MFSMGCYATFCNIHIASYISNMILSPQRMGLTIYSQVGQNNPSSAKSAACALKSLGFFFFSLSSWARDYHWQNRVSWKCSLMWYDAPSIIKFWTLLLRPIYSFVWKITQMKFAWLETESKWATTIESLRLESSFSLSWATVMHLYWWTHPKGSYYHRHETFNFFPLSEDHLCLYCLWDLWRN